MGTKCGVEDVMAALRDGASLDVNVLSGNDDI